MANPIINSFWLPMFATPWIVARQAPLSMELSRQGYWRGLPFPSPGHLLDPRIDPRSPASQADSLPSEHQGSPVTHEAVCDPSSSLCTFPLFSFFLRNALPCIARSHFKTFTLPILSAKNIFSSQIKC